MTHPKREFTTDHAETIRLYLSGLSITKVAEQMPFSRSTVFKILRDNKVKRRASWEDRRLPVWPILERAIRGDQMKQIAADRGVLSSGLYRMLHLRGIYFGPRYVQALRDMTPDVRERYRIAIDEMQMRHPDAIDYAFDD